MQTSDADDFEYEWDALVAAERSLRKTLALASPDLSPEARQRWEDAHGQLDSLINDLRCERHEDEFVQATIGGEVVCATCGDRLTACAVCRQPLAWHDAVDNCHAVCASPDPDGDAGCDLPEVA